MCDGFKVHEDVNELGLIKKAIRCVQCGSYVFEPEIEQKLIKCKHGSVYCGICERVERRKAGKVK